MKKEQIVYARVSDDTKKKFVAKCGKEHRSMSDTIRMWIDQYLKGEK